MSGDDSDPDPIKRAPLKNFVKEQTDLRAGSDALDELEAGLLYLTELLWKEASLRAENDGMKTVKKSHFNSAYKELFEPHRELQKSSSKLEQMSEEMEELSKRSPVYKDWESYDE